MPTETTTKLRVLCLHGYAQNGETLRGRIAAFRRAFKSSAEFGACVCISSDRSWSALSGAMAIVLTHSPFLFLCLSSPSLRTCMSTLTVCVDAPIVIENDPFAHAKETARCVAAARVHQHFRCRFIASSRVIRSVHSRQDIVAGCAQRR